MSDFYTENDTRPDSHYRKILDLIPTGKKNAVKLSDLAESLGVDLIQMIRVIRHAQFDGNIIAVMDCGVFIPNTKGDLYDYVAHEMGRIAFDIEALNHAHKLLSGERLTMVYKSEDFDE